MKSLSNSELFRIAVLFLGLFGVVDFCLGSAEQGYPNALNDRPFVSDKTKRAMLNSGLIIPEIIDLEESAGFMYEEGRRPTKEGDAGLMKLPDINIVLLGADKKEKEWGKIMEYLPFEMLPKLLAGMADVLANVLGHGVAMKALLLSVLASPLLAIKGLVEMLKRK